MDYSEKIRKLLKAGKIKTQVDLAAAIGVDQATISRYVSKNAKPDSVSCLCLAGLSDDSDDRSYWLSLSGISAQQMELIGNAITPGRPAHARALSQHQARRLIEILASGNDEAKTAIRQQLEMWHRIATGGGTAQAPRERKRA